MKESQGNSYEEGEEVSTTDEDTNRKDMPVEEDGQNGGDDPIPMTEENRRTNEEVSQNTYACTVSGFHHYDTQGNVTGTNMDQNETPLLDHDGRRIDYNFPVFEEDRPTTYQPSVQHWNEAMSVEGAQEIIEYLLDTQREGATGNTLASSSPSSSPSASASPSRRSRSSLLSPPSSPPFSPEPLARGNTITITLPAGTETVVLVEPNGFRRVIPIERRTRDSSRQPRPNLRFLHRFAKERYETLRDAVRGVREPRMVIAATILFAVYGTCQEEYLQQAQFYHRIAPPPIDHVPLAKYPMPKTKSVCYFLNRHAHKWDNPDQSDNANQSDSFHYDDPFFFNAFM